MMNINHLTPGKYCTVQDVLKKTIFRTVSYRLISLKLLLNLVF